MICRHECCKCGEPMQRQINPFGMAIFIIVLSVMTWIAMHAIDMKAHADHEARTEGRCR